MTGDNSMKESKILQTIDNMNEWVGRVASFGYVAILLIQVMEVILRYVFNSPTIWAWDVNAQLFMGVSILGGAYVLLHDAHVRVDVLYGRVSERKKAIFDSISYTLTTLALAILTWQLADMTWESWRIQGAGAGAFLHHPSTQSRQSFLSAYFCYCCRRSPMSYRRLRFLSEQEATRKGEA